MKETKPVVARIRREMAGGVISFARFMELALYAPGLGYYERDDTAIGRRGDFYTSVSVGSLFGELLAFLFAEELDNGRADDTPPATGVSPQLVEAGAHDGRLAADILGWLRRRRPALLATLEYWIIEPSERRRGWQQKTLADFAPRVRWAEAIRSVPPCAFRILFCNELLDALPVHRLGWDAAARQWFEWGVSWDGQRFVWQRMARESVGRGPWAVGRSTTLAWEEPTTDYGLPTTDDSALLVALPDGFTIEVCPAAVQWWRDAAQALHRGKLLAIDYGMTAEELFVPERPRGTLRAHRHHHVSDDLLAAPGEQDLTAHVNFTALQRAGEAAGLRTAALVSQGQFLTGIAQRAWASPESFGEWTPRHSRQFQTLTHPNHLGRALRVLIQSRRK